MEELFSDRLLSTVILIVWMIMTIGLFMAIGFFGLLILLSETWTSIPGRALDGITRNP